MLATRRLLPRLIATSSVPATSSCANQKRNYFTRHVPEPKMQIHLPNPQASDGTAETLVLSEHQHLDEKKPVVLIIGWAGANPKHIDKYINIYNDEG
uniref:Transmembrane protein 53 n=2 Tax=Caenorhabditis japonica TaxID=281687 RepID=A0A8R1E6Q9_CAEJA